MAKAKANLYIQHIRSDECVNAERDLQAFRDAIRYLGGCLKGTQLSLPVEPEDAEQILTIYRGYLENTIRLIDEVTG